MTTLAYAGTYHPRLGKMFDATPPVVWHCPVAAAEGLYAGDFVLRTSGLIVEYASAGSALLGILKEDTPVAAGEVEVLVCTPMTGIRIPVHHDTILSSDIEEADHGKATYDLNFVGGNAPHWYVDKATTGTAVTIQQFVDPVGTVNGHVLITVNYGTREVS